MIHMRTPAPAAGRRPGQQDATTVNQREQLRRSFEVELATVRAELLAYGRHLLRRREELPDALQTILLTAYRRFEEFRPGTSFKAWIFQIATYEIFNLNRKSAREWKLRVPWDEEEIDRPRGESDPLAELEREGACDQLLRDPEVLARVLDAELQGAIASLPPKERAVLLLRIVGGFSTSETARMLSMPAGSVMGLLGRARRKLRLSLADYAREAGILRPQGEPKR